TEDDTRTLNAYFVPAERLAKNGEFFSQLMAHRYRFLAVFGQQAALPAKEFLAEVRRLNGIRKEVLEHEELLEIVIPLLRADFALYETYVYSAEPPLNCPISAFGGLQDSKVTRSDLEAWRDQTTGAFSLRMLP